MTRQVIERNRLGALTKIAQGGQGVVYHAPNVRTKFAASMVYKEYKPATLAAIDLTALAAMPALVEDSLSYADAERLISIAAWPCALVEDSGSTTGFVMPGIPDEFFIPLTTVKGVSTVSAEFQHLLNHPTVLGARGINIDDAQRYALLREVASSLAFLHRSGVCIGDLSPKNLLFSLTPREAIYFIDCDATRINGVSALTQLETPGWDAPAGEELATAYTDTYKLGLLALRLLVGDHDTTNPQHLPATTPNLLRQVITDTLRNRPDGRPLPEAWNYVLGNAIEYARSQPKDPAANIATTPASQPPPAPVVHSRPSGSVPPSRPIVSTPLSRPPAPPPPPPWMSAPVAAQAPTRRPERIFAVVTIVALIAIIGMIVLIANSVKHNSDSTAQSTATYSSTSIAESTSTPSETTESTTTESTVAPTTIAPPPPPPPPQDAWIAIAGVGNGGLGWYQSTESSGDAMSRAVGKCNEVNPGSGCIWLSWSENGCVAVAQSGNGSMWGGSGSTEAEAIQNAQNRSGGGRLVKALCVIR